MLLLCPASTCCLVSDVKKKLLADIVIVQKIAHLHVNCARFASTLTQNAHRIIKRKEKINAAERKFARITSPQVHEEAERMRGGGERSRARQHHSRSAEATRHTHLASYSVQGRRATTGENEALHHASTPRPPQIRRQCAHRYATYHRFAAPLFTTLFWQNSTAFPFRQAIASYANDTSYCDKLSLLFFSLSSSFLAVNMPHRK